MYTQIVALRRATGDGPARIAQAVGCAASTVYRILRKHRLHRPDHLDRITIATSRHHYRRVVTVEWLTYDRAAVNIR